MQTLTIDLKKKNSFEIGQQGDHNALCVHFINLKNVGANKKYIFYTIDDYSNMVPLTNDRFTVGYPLTMYSGAVRAQIICKLDNNTIIKLSNEFIMNILPSSAYVDTGDYPIDPNIQSAYDLLDDLINQGTSLINQFNAIDIGKYSQLMNKLNQSVNAAKTSETNAKTSETNAAASARELANLGLYVDSDGYIVQEVEE